jgi:dihydrofolate synthase/folylpolyglutamate synthase
LPIDPVPRTPPRCLGDWLAYQETLHPRAIELGLDRVRSVAARLDLLRPRARTLTVAGTNGKGSTVALLDGIYRAAGYRVGAYTSPHLLRYNERVAIDGRLAHDAALCAAFERIEAARGTVPLTYFEYGTLAALWLFRAADVDVQVLEVGLGGRLDAVNIVDADAALVTNIGLDHTDWLGADRESIGREKAGVFRRDRVAICVDPDPPASIAATARAVGAPLRCIDVDFRYSPRAQSLWDWRGRTLAFEGLPAPALFGATQLRNAAGALALVEAMQAGLPVPEAAVRAALPALRLAGRFERRGSMIFDVAHNAEAAQVLAHNLRDAGLAGRVRLVLGMLADKPIEAVAQTLAPVVIAAYFGGLPPPRGLPAAALAQRACILRGERFPDILSAFAAAKRDLGDGEVVLVCGSFLTVSEVARQTDG